MKKLYSLIRRYPYIFTILTVCFFLSAANYTPGTILSGWDTLHPEFNKTVYLKRVLFGVWQDHQGLGALATQSHIAELPRLLLYYPLAFILDESFVRYAYFFLMIFLGPLGVYFFVRRAFFQDKKDERAQIASTLGALFYLLNLGTLQHFHVPFEMFATHFASLGWVFLFVYSYLTTRSTKSLIWYAVTTLFVASISHTPTLWYVYFSTLVLFLIAYVSITRTKSALRCSTILIALTLALNAFWIIPSLYFILTDGHAVESSKIHSLFSEEAFEQNAAFGNIGDFVFFKNFLFNWKIYTSGTQFAPLLNAWINHLKNPIVSLLGYSFFSLICVGLIAVIKKKNAIALAMLPIYLLSFFFWMNVNPPFGSLFVFLQTHIPFFKEVFRFPFTKFSILLIFISASYFALGIGFIVEFLSSIIKKKNVAKIVFFVILIAQIFFMLPAFQGNFISPSMRVSIPQDYFKLFSWFDKEPNYRVATLPIHSFWGWTYYKWGYQGAGFLWFGIKQPLLDREFDRWNPLNEQYYREMSQAIYTQNQTLLSQVLEKYNIGYILVDKNVISPGSDQKMLFFPQIEKMLQGRPDIGAPIHFGKNIIVYPTKYGSSGTQSMKNPKKITPRATVFYDDAAFERYGPYINKPSGTSTVGKEIYYPFRTIIDNQNRFITKSVGLTQEGIAFHLPNTSTPIEQLPYTTTEQMLPAQVVIERTGRTIETTFYPYNIASNNFSTAPLVFTTQLPVLNPSAQLTVSVNNTYAIALKDLPEDTPLSLGTIMLQTQKTNTVGLYSSDTEQTVRPRFSTKSMTPYACDPGNINNKTYGFTVDRDEGGFTVLGKNTAVCLIIPLVELLPEIETDTMMKLEYTNTDNAPSGLCIVELTNGICKDQILKNYTTSNDNTTISWYFPLKAGQEDNLGIKILFDTTENPSSVAQSHYSNFSLTVLDRIDEVSITKELLVESFANSEESVETKTIVFPYAGDERLSFDITKMPKTDGRCNDTQLFTFDNRKDVLKEENQRYLRYVSNDGSLCDHFSYQLLPHTSGYIVAITARNVSGLPIRLCIANYLSKRCDLYTTLSKSKSFHTDLFFLPMMQDSTSSGPLQKGYDININNFGIKNRGSINDIQSIQIAPIPSKWLSTFNTDTEEKPLKTTVSSLSPERPHQDFVILKDITSLTKSDVLALDTAYHEGWRAYRVNLKKVWLIDDITILFPFIFGQKIDDHVLVNGWENGWNLSQKNLSFGKNDAVVMLFLPQYLAYFGYVCLLGGVAVLLSKRPRRKLTSEDTSATIS